MKALGLYVVVGRYRLRPTTASVSFVQHEAVRVPVNDPNGDSLIFFSEKRRAALLAEEATAYGADDIIGLLYGYPRCCIDFFNNVRCLSADRTSLSISSLGPFPKAMNPVLPALTGITILFHFPCSPFCSQSRRMLEERIAWLDGRASTSEKLRVIGRGIGVYGSDLGAALLPGLVGRDATTFELRNAWTSGGPIKALIRRSEPAYLRIEDVHSFRVGNCAFSGSEYFVAQFE